MPGVMKTGMVRKFGTGGVAPSAYRTLLLSYSPSLYWPLDAVYGADDQSAGGTNDGTAVGPTIGGHTATYAPITGEDASCTDLDGVDDRVEATGFAPFVDGNTVTICGWYYRDTSGTRNDWCWGSLNADYVMAYYVNYADNITVFASGGGSGEYGPLVGAGTWHFLAWVWNSSTNDLTIYLNGSSVGTQSVAGWAASPGIFAISARGTDYGAGWDGKQAHVAVVEGALTGTQISDLYAAAS